MPAFLSPPTLAVITIVLIIVVLLAVPPTRKMIVSRLPLPGKKKGAVTSIVTTTTTTSAPLRTTNSAQKRGTLLYVPHGTFFVVRHSQIEKIPPEPGGEKIPAKLTVARDHAVTLEDAAGQYFGIVTGPAVHDLPLGVEPRQIIITRPRFKRITINDLPTKDGRSVARVDFGVQYQIDLDEEEDVELKTPRPRLQSLFRAAYRVVLWEEHAGTPHPVESWEMAVQEMAKNTIRQEVARRRLEDLFHADEPAFLYESIENEALAKLQGIVSEWGVQIERIQIHGMWPSEEYRHALVLQWETQRASLAQAEQVKLLERAKGESWRRMILDVQQGVANKKPNQLTAVALVQFLKYLDTMIEVAKTTERPPMIPEPARLEKLIADNMPKPESATEVESKIKESEQLTGGTRPKDTTSRVA